MNTEIKKKIYAFAKQNMGRELSHDFSHASRVATLAVQIAMAEGVSKAFQAEIAGLLHDIALGTCDRKNHGEAGANMAIDFLSNKCNSVFSVEEISEIAYAILWHNRKLSAPDPSILLDILVDADTLDLLGAVGIWRGIAALDHSQLPNAQALTTAQARFCDYDTVLGRAREENLHGMDAQLNFQMKSAEIITTKTAKKLAEPLLSTMKSFRYMLVHELSYSLHV